MQSLRYKDQWNLARRLRTVQAQPIPEEFIAWLESKMPQGIDRHCMYVHGYDPHTRVKHEAYRIARNCFAPWGFTVPPTEPAGSMANGDDLYRVLDQLRVWVEDNLAQREAATAESEAAPAPRTIAQPLPW